MKNYLLIILFLSLLSSKILAQQTYEITPFAGYTLADKFNIDQGTASISSGVSYGATLSLISDKVNALELTYSRLDADVSAYSEFHEIDLNSPVGLNYVFLGGTRLFPLRMHPIEFFVGVNFGVAIMGSKDDDFESSTRMAVGFNGGLKYFFSKTIGLRLQPNLNLPISNPGGELWWNPATGTEADVPSAVPLMQFGVTCGLVYQLK